MAAKREDNTETIVIRGIAREVVEESSDRIMMRIDKSFTEMRSFMEARFATKPELFDWAAKLHETANDRVKVAIADHENYMHKPGSLIPKPRWRPKHIISGGVITSVIGSIIYLIVNWPF